MAVTVCRGFVWLVNVSVAVPETEEYDISSFVFRDRRPFHPVRFWHYLSENFPAGIIRSKGLFWLASRPDDALNFNQAGALCGPKPPGFHAVCQTLRLTATYLPLTHLLLKPVAMYGVTGLSCSSLVCF
ncbi:hypothetical protein GCM10027190_59620 [Spirosoma areae]